MTQIMIGDLADAPRLFDQVVACSVAEWSALTDLGEVEMRPLFDPCVAREGGLPVTLVAVGGERLAGFVSLRAITMGAIRHPEAYLEGKGPWLSNMWIEPWARGAGLASRLTLAIEDRARALGHGEIVSSTGRGDSLYHRLGYADVATRHLNGVDIHVIAKTL